MRTLPLLSLLAALCVGCGDDPAPEAADPKPFEAVGDAVTRSAEEVGAVVENAAATAGATLDDAALRVAVKAALVEDEELDARDLTVEVEDGVVTLSGDIGTLGQKMHATDVTNDIDGVRRVQNRLSVGR